MNTILFSSQSEVGTSAKLNEPQTDYVSVSSKDTLNEELDIEIEKHVRLYNLKEDSSLVSYLQGIEFCLDISLVRSEMANPFSFSNQFIVPSQAHVLGFLKDIGDEKIKHVLFSLRLDSGIYSFNFENRRKNSKIRSGTYHLFVCVEGQCKKYTVWIPK